MDQEQAVRRAAEAPLGPKWYQLSDLRCINPDGHEQPT